MDDCQQADLSMADNTLIFHVSDIHFGNEDRAALDWVAREIERKRPAALAVTGDLTMRARHHEFAAAADWFTTLDLPILIEPGNHDLPGYHLPSRYLRPLARFRKFRDAVERRIDFPKLAMVPLNSNVPAQFRLNWSKGVVTPKALRECLAAIDALPSGTQALVAVHHPLREAGTRGTAYTKGGSTALAELAKRPVAGVLSGHVHDAFDIMEPTDNGPVRMIGAGTLSQRLRASPASFNELSWDGETLHVEQRSQ